MRIAGSIAATIAVVACARAGWADDETERPGGAVVVIVRPGAGAAPWVAAALEQNVERELAGSERLRVLDKRDLPALDCGFAADCVVRGYAAVGADIVFLATVDGTEVSYALYETWTPARIDRGELDVGPDTGLISLKQQTLRAFRPVLTQGGLLDQKPYVPGATAGADASPPPVRVGAARPQLVFGVLLAIAGALLAPLLVGALSMRRPRLARLARLPAAWLAVGLAASCAGLAALALSRSEPVPPLLPERWQWLAGTACGMAWGALIVDSLRFVFPPLHGLERVGHRDVFRLIKEWLLACMQRAGLLVAYYAPVAAMGSLACDAVAVSSQEAIVVVAPALGLLARFWLAAWVQCLAPGVDDHLVLGEASRDNPWHAELQRYFMGYVRRSGWNVDHRLLSRIVFLPGATDRVTSYGGAGTSSRIVVDERLVQLALGALEDAPVEQSDVPWPQWSAGIVVPDSRPAGRRGSRAVSAAAQTRAVTSPPSMVLPRVRSRTHSDHGKSLGQAATLLGYVVPVAPGELVPLIADDVGDLDVVRELLSEHYAWYAPDPDEEDDDTDPTDKDLLFGALARELGAIERRDQQRSTLGLAWVEYARRGSGPVRRALAAVAAFVRAVTSRYPAIVADAYVALHFGRHHLIQYLFYRHTGETSLLTARATPVVLARKSTDMIAAVAAWKTGGRMHWVTNASLRNRLVWLSRFFSAPLIEPREARVRKLIAAGVAVGAIAVLGLAVKRAVDYNPVYVDRIDQQEQDLRQSQAEAAQPDPHSDDREPTDNGEIQATE